MKNTKNCSIGVRKLQEFYRQIELDNSIIDKFLDKNFYQNICGFNFDELCDSFLKEKERIVNKYKNQFDFDINNIIKLFQNHTFYKSILGMDFVVIYNSIMLGDFKILNRNSGEKPSGLEIYSAGFSNIEFSPKISDENFKEFFSTLCYELNTFLNRDFKDFILRTPLRSMIDGKQAYVYGSEVQIDLHHSIVKDYLTRLVFELINDILCLVNRIQGKGKRLYYSISENCLTFDSSKKSLFYIGKLESDYFSKLAIFENKKEKSFHYQKDKVKKLFSAAVFNSVEGGFTLEQVKSNLVPLSLLTDTEIRDSLKDFSTIKSIKKRTSEEQFERFMNLLSQI